MIATASIRKHPLHPMLIPLPIGLWIFSFACDIAMFFSGREVWNEMAFYTMAGGVMGGVIAALPGMLDLFTMDPSPQKTLGLWHMGVNLTVVVLFVINLFWRRESSLEWGQAALSAVSILLLAVSGWLGGEMVYVYGVGVEPVDREKL